MRAVRTLDWGASAETPQLCLEPLAGVSADRNPLREMDSDSRGRKAAAEDFAGLIDRVARERDRGAFIQLYRQFAPRVRTLMLRMGATPEQADEIVQECLLSVWRKAHLFNPQGASASGWIFRIARNLRIDYLRSARRAEALATDVDLTVLEVERPDTIVTAAQIGARVRAAIARLSPEQLAVITLSFLESRPHAEIADMLQVPLGTVKSRIRLAMKRLRELLDEVA
jgi:RNA polymerase sigma-70 factor, ECF subfamily